jgi:hypothetical protein
LQYFARIRERLRIDPNEDREKKIKQRQAGKNAVEDTKVILATDEPKHLKNLKMRHGFEEDSPVVNKNNKPRCPNCSNKHRGACNKDPVTCSLCKGKGHMTKFCVNSSASAPKRQQPNNDDKSSEDKHKVNHKRRERLKRGKAGANIAK